MNNRDTKIYIAAIGYTDPNLFEPPLTDNEMKQFESHRKWARETQKKAAEEGRQIEFEIPFDP